MTQLKSGKSSSIHLHFWVQNVNFPVCTLGIIRLHLSMICVHHEKTGWFQPVILQDATAESTTFVATTASATATTAVGVPKSNDPRHPVIPPEVFGWYVCRVQNNTCSGGGPGCLGWKGFKISHVGVVVFLTFFLPIWRIFFRESWDTVSFKDNSWINCFILIGSVSTQKLGDFFVFDWG